MTKKRKPVEPARPCHECSGSKQSHGHECYVCKTDKDWTKPFPLSKVEVVFPAGALHFMPKEEEIPKEFWPGRGDETEKSAAWLRFQSDWFFAGIKPSLQIDLKEGVDGEVAMAHLAAIQGTFACSHQHKEASFAYLCSLWFNEAMWERYTPDELKAMKEEQKEKRLAKEKDRAAADDAGTDSVRPTPGDDGCCHITGDAGATEGGPPGAEGEAPEEGPRPAA